jgi:hypothetical protein
MSHYVHATFAVTSRAALVAALMEFGFHPEVHDTPVALVGYMGDARLDVAHVIVRRAEVGRSSNDIGFLQRADGTWEAIVSSFDQRRYYGTDWQAEIARLSGVHAIIAEANAQGLVWERGSLETGETYVDVYAQEN